MTDNISGERFVGYKKGGWHRLGTVSMVELTAVEGLAIMGDYEPFTVPARIRMPLERVGLQLDSPFEADSGYKGIIRPPIAEDPEYRLFGVVKNGYRLVTPREFCETADRATSNRRIETIGVLAKGAQIFACYALPIVSVRGDEHEVYVSLVNDMTGSGSLRIFLTFVRTVCENTVEAGWMSAIERHKLKHTDEVLSDMEFWLSSMIGKVEAETEALREVFDVLAGATVSSQLVENTLEVAYPHRVMPNLRGVRSTERIDLMQSNIHEHNQRMNGFREQVRHLFEGRATGYDHPNMKGTAYGLYNSVVEHEDWRKGRAKESALVGSRAQTKARAYRTIASGIGLIGKN